MRKFKSVFILVIFFIAANLYPQNGWQSTFQNNPFNISKIVQKNESSIFAFGYGSRYLLKTTNGGNNWQTYLSFDSSYTIFDGCFVNDMTGWISGQNWYNSAGEIFKTTDGGEVWEKQSTNYNNYLCSGISFINNNTGWICTAKRENGSVGRLLKTTNSGSNWSANDFPGIYQISQAKFFDGNNGWILGYGATSYLAKTTNGGQNWITVSINNIPSFINILYSKFYMFDMNLGYVLMRGNNYNNSTSMIFKTENGGQNWNLVFSYTDILTTNSRSFTNIDFLNTNTGYLSGSFDFFFKTTDAGASWDSLNTISNMPNNSLLLSNNNIYAGGGGQLNSSPYSYVLKSTNAGNNWRVVSEISHYNFKDLHFKSRETGIVLNDKGNIFNTTNAGDNWNVISEFSNYAINNFAFINNDTGFGICSNKIIRTTDFGNSWNEVQDLTNSGISEIQFINSQNGFAVYPYGLFKTSNSGKNWHTIENFPIPPNGYYCKSISFLNENTGWLLMRYDYYLPFFGTTHFNKIIKTTNSGLNWSNLYELNNSSESFEKIKFISEINGHVIINGTKMNKTNDGGLSWYPYSSNPNVLLGKMVMANQSIGWCIGYKLFNGINCGAIYKTTDGALTWGTQFLDSSRNLNAINLIDENNVWFCGNDNSIYKTTDGGGIISAVFNANEVIPNNFSLSQNYPNPFNPSTRINYELKITNYVSLKVFNLLGKEVASLVNEKQSAGSYAVDFNSAEYNLPSGIYFYTLNAGEFKETKKMVLIK